MLLFPPVMTTFSLTSVPLQVLFLSKLLEKIPINLITYFYCDSEKSATTRKHPGIVALEKRKAGAVNLHKPSVS